MIKKVFGYVLVPVIAALFALGLYTISSISAQALDYAPIPTPLPTLPTVRPPLNPDISSDFIDPNFRQAVWNWLGKSGTPGSFTQKDITDRINGGENRLEVIEKHVSSLNGLEYFTGIDFLDCSINDLTVLPGLPDTLTALKCGGNKLTALPELPDSLIGLDCHANLITGLQELPASLEVLDCDNNKLSVLPVLPGTLKYLFCSGNELIGLPALPQLKTLDCSSNKLRNLPNIPNTLLQLSCNQNQLTSLPSYLPSSLQELNCTHNQLTNLPSLPDSVNVIHADFNLLTRLPDFPNNLGAISCSNNQLASLPDFPPSLRSLYISNNLFISLPDIPNTITLLDCKYNYLNIFVPAFPLYPERTGYTFFPQYRIKYAGLAIELNVGEARTLTGSDIKRQMSSDDMVWGDTENIPFTDVLFQSSNNSVAKVDTTGLITATGEGNCSIYVLYKGINSALTKTEIPIVCKEVELQYGEASSYAVPFLDQAVELGIIPDRLKGKSMIVPTTREEFAELAVKFYEKATGRAAAIPAGKTFTDCSNPEVLKAFGLGITAGVGDGTRFEPNTILSRQQMAAMITRTLKACYPNIIFDVAGQPDFKDQDQFAPYAVTPAKFMAKYTITVGDGNGHFDPKGQCLRQQTIIFLVKSYNFRSSYVYE